MSTLKAISEQSGYSLATISRVLNGDSSIKVKDETRKTILDIAEDLNYKSNKRTYLHNIQESSWRIVNNFPKKEELADPYYLSIRHGIENGLERLKASYEYCYSDTNRDINWSKDLVLMIGYSADDALGGFPLDFQRTVFVDSCIPKFDSVAADLNNAMVLLYKYLRSLGHEDIVFLGASDGRGEPDIREQIFLTLSAQKSKNLPTVLRANNFSIEAAYNKMKHYIDRSKKLHSVILAANDSLAIGAMHALYEKDIMIPDDISIVGINGIPMGQFTQPSLTTINIETEEIGAYAVNMLVEKFHSERKSRIEVLFPPNLEIRNSVIARSS